MTLITFLGFGILGQPLRSYSMIVVMTGNFGHGSAQPIIHIIGKSTTCKLSATKKA